MRKFFLQHGKILVRFLSCILLPCFLFGYLLYAGIGDFNYTLLLNDPDLWLISRILAFIILCWFLYGVYRQGLHTLPKKQLLPGILLNAVMLCAVILIPYRKDESFFSSLHVFMAYASLLLYNVIVQRVYGKEKIYQYLYLPGCILSAFLALYAGEISGPCEAVYGSVTAILLGCCFR